MALTFNVTEVSVKEVNSRLFHVVFNLICFNDTEQVINKNYFMVFNTKNDLDSTRADVLKRMQNDINKYNEELDILERSEVGTTAIWLQNNLVNE
jgi:hypothetical protein